MIAFRSPEKFLCGNLDGSVSLFNGAKLVKTTTQKSTAALVGYFDGQIVAATANELTVMNEDLETFWIIDEIENEAGSISGNETYLAVSENEFISYYSYNPDFGPQVSFPLKLTEI